MDTIVPEIFSGAFFFLSRKYAKSTTTSFVMSVRVEHLGYHWMDFHEIWYFSIFRKKKSGEKFQVLLISDKNNGTLHEDRYTFLIISCWIIFRIRNVSDKICTENQTTHFVFSYFSPKIVPFMRTCGKNIVQPGRPEMTNMAHAHCMPDI